MSRRIAAEPWTIENGLLMPTQTTLKLKRAKIL
jgi:hypothetical protein